jgi:hypothetical protein
MTRRRWRADRSEVSTLQATVATPDAVLEPNRWTTPIEVPTPLYEKLRAIATELGVDVSRVAQSALESYVEGVNLVRGQS